MTTTPDDAAMPDDMKDALEIGLNVQRMITEIERRGGEVKYLAVMPGQKVLALADKFSPDEEAGMISAASKEQEKGNE